MSNLLFLRVAHMCLCHVIPRRVSLVGPNRFCLEYCPVMDLLPECGSHPTSLCVIYTVCVKSTHTLLTMSVSLPVRPHDLS
jgi:hypothetical protein